MSIKQTSLESGELNLASLLVCCADQIGTIASLATFFAERDLSISRYAEYTDNGQCYTRFEWSINDLWEDEHAFAAEFSRLANLYKASFDVRFMNRKQSIGLLVSRQAHGLIDMLNKVEANYFSNADIRFIVSDDQSTQKIADRHGVPFFYIAIDSAATENSSLEYEKKQLDIIHRYKPDYLGLVDYKQVLSANFVEQVTCPIVGVNHSFIPSLIGTKPFQIAHDRGVKLIGATSYFVTAQVGDGPIIEQDVARIRSGASVQEMIKVGRDIQQKVFASAMLKVLEHKTILHKNRTIIFD